MIRLVLGIVLMALLTAFVAPRAAGAGQFVAASGAPHINKPLMVIRFNQRRVFYKKPLFTALSKALQAAPAVQFNLVSYVPTGAGEGQAQRWLATANQHLRDVTDQMRQMGVPAAQIAINNEIDPTLKYDEIHIFVQ